MRVAIITGADRGIGFQVSRELGVLGFKIVLTSPDRARGQTALEKARVSWKSILISSVPHWKLIP